jgi:hypothetical protein
VYTRIVATSAKPSVIRPAAIRGAAVEVNYAELMDLALELLR